MPYENLSYKFETCLQKVANAKTIQVEGKVTRLVGLTIEAVGIDAPVGSTCLIIKSTSKSSSSRSYWFR